MSNFADYLIIVANSNVFVNNFLFLMLKIEELIDFRYFIDNFFRTLRFLFFSGINVI
jgi:hypothetical protein